MYKGASLKSIALFFEQLLTPRPPRAILVVFHFYAQGELLMSNLIACETCGKEIAKKAKTCPNCGAKRTTRGFFKTILIVIVVFMGLAVIGGLQDPDVQTSIENDLTVSEVPECSSTEGIVAVVDRLNEKRLETSSSSQQSLAESFELIDIINTSQKSYDEANKTRTCLGEVLTNRNGSFYTQYTFQLLSSGEIYVDAFLKM